MLRGRTRVPRERGVGSARGKGMARASLGMGDAKTAETMDGGHGLVNADTAGATPSPMLAAATRLDERGNHWAHVTSAKATSTSLPPAAPPVHLCSPRPLLQEPHTHPDAVGDAHGFGSADVFGPAPEPDVVPCPPWVPCVPVAVLLLLLPCTISSLACIMGSWKSCQNERPHTPTDELPGDSDGRTLERVIVRWQLLRT